MPRASTLALTAPTRALTVVTVVTALAACAGETPPAAGESLGHVSLALADTDPVSEAVSASCTTASVKGLSSQLVAEIQCMRPGSMKSIEGIAGLELGSAVFPYLQTPAADALLLAQKARGATMSINSALRTLPQQYLLYRWYKAGRCGISLAAVPGGSNHETAVALDIDDAQGWRPAMESAGFRWLGASDPVHFDYTGPGAIEMRGLSVTAFQRLWNRNHPEDPIGEDGDYGAETEKRLARAPVGGFPRGADDCDGDGGADGGAPPAPPDAPTTPDRVPDASEPADDSGCSVSVARLGQASRGSTTSLIALALALVLFGAGARRRRAPTARRSR